MNTGFDVCAIVLAIASSLLWLDTHISIMMPIANRPRDVSCYSLKVTIPTTSAWCASTISNIQKMGEARGHAGQPCHSMPSHAMMNDEHIFFDDENEFQPPLGSR